MSFKSTILLTAAEEARDRARAVSKHQFDLVPTDPIVAVVMAAGAVEGFINEFAERVDAWVPIGRLKPEFRVADPIANCGRELLRLVDQRTNIEKKLLVAAEALGGGEILKRGRQPFQDLHLLVQLRNLIMHIKSQDGYIVDVETGEIQVKQAPPVVVLQQRGIAPKPTESEGPDWLRNLQTFEVADWACACARGIIIELLKLIPREPPANQKLFGDLFKRYPP